MFHNFKKIINRSVRDTKIKYQLIVYATISFFVVLLGFIFITDNFFNQLTSEVKKESQTRLMSKVENDIKYKLLMSDYLGVAKIAEDELLRGDIDAMIISYSVSNSPDDTGVIAYIVEKETKKVASVKANEIDRAQLDKNFYVRKILTDSIGNSFARVEVYFNKSSVQYVADVSKYLITFILVTNFCIFLYIMVKILDKILVSRLKNLHEALVVIIAKNVNSGGFLEIVEEDELGDIKKTINDIHAKMISVINDKKSVNDKLEQQIREIELLQKQIIQAEKIAGLGAIVGGVAHELNSPLSSVNVIAETINENIEIFKTHLQSKKCSLTDVKTFIENIEEGLKILYSSNTKALQLIQEFKSAVSSQTDEQIVKIKPKKFIQELMNLIKTTYPVTNITVKIEVDEDAQEIETMRGCLFRVMTGLVSNVYVHAFPNNAKGIMKIHVKSIDEKYLEISVADNGIGIKEEYLDKVFDPFFTTSLNHKNQGLGLHLALTETIKNLKGTLTAAGTENKGATFTLIIPRKIIKQ